MERKGRLLLLILALPLLRLRLLLRLLLLLLLLLLIAATYAVAFSERSVLRLLGADFAVQLFFSTCPPSGARVFVPLRGNGALASEGGLD